ncbi:hypothetical protein D9M70_469250 [compost metagenome]
MLGQLLDEIRDRGKPEQRAAANQGHQRVGIGLILDALSQIRYRLASEGFVFRGEAVRVLEIVFAVLLLCHPFWKQPSDVQLQPGVAGSFGGQTELFDTGTQPELVFLVVDGKKHPLLVGQAADPRQADVVAVAFQQTVKAVTHAASPPLPWSGSRGR